MLPNTRCYYQVFFPGNIQWKKNLLACNFNPKKVHLWNYYIRCWPKEFNTPKFLLQTVWKFDLLHVYWTCTFGIRYKALCAKNYFCFRCLSLEWNATSSCYRKEPFQNVLKIRTSCSWQVLDLLKKNYLCT